MAIGQKTDDKYILAVWTGEITRTSNGEMGKKNTRKFKPKRKKKRGLLPYSAILQLLYFLSTSTEKIVGSRIPIHEHYRTVMVNHVPLLVVKLIDIGHMEWPRVYINISFHGNPCHITEHTSSYIPYLKGNTWTSPSLNPIECQSPTINHCSIPIK